MALTLATELADYASGIGTQGATLKIDADNKRVGVGTTNPQGPEGTLQVGTGITFFGNTGIISAIGGKFSGDFTVGGTLTYEDVQNVNSSGVGTFSGGINVVGGGLTVTGVSTFFDNVNLGDNDRLRFGADNDLQIYHDGTDSYVQDSRNNGRLRLSADILQVIDKDATETMLKATVDGAVELNYNGSTKFETTGVGVTVTGVTTSRGFVLAEDDGIHFRTTDADDLDAILRASAGGGQLLINSRNDTIINIDSNNDSSNAHFAIGHGAATGSSTELFRVQENGKVGINTNDPAGLFQIESTSTTDMIMLNVGGLNFAKLGHNSASGTDILDIRSEGHTRFLAGGNNERVRINSAGRVGIATVLPEAQLTVKGDGDIGAKDFKYTYSNTHGIQVKGNESAIDIVGTDGGNHGSSLLLRSSLDGFGLVFDPTKDQLRVMYTVPNADDFSIHDGNNTSTNTEALIIGKTGICTATQLFEGTSRVATAGKAVAMALVFG